MADYFFIFIFCVWTTGIYFRGYKDGSKNESKFLPPKDDKSNYAFIGKFSFFETTENTFSNLNALITDEFYYHVEFEVRYSVGFVYKKETTKRFSVTGAKKNILLNYITFFKTIKDTKGIIFFFSKTPIQVDIFIYLREFGYSVVLDENRFLKG